MQKKFIQELKGFLSFYFMFMIFVGNYSTVSYGGKYTEAFLRECTTNELKSLKCQLVVTEHSSLSIRRHDFHDASGYYSAGGSTFRSASSHYTMGNLEVQRCSRCGTRGATYGRLEAQLERLGSGQLLRVRHIFTPQSDPCRRPETYHMDPDLKQLLGDNYHPQSWKKTLESLWSKARRLDTEQKIGTVSLIGAERCNDGSSFIVVEDGKSECTCC